MIYSLIEIFVQQALQVENYGLFQEYLIQTRHGSVSVAVYGDQEKTALVTYPDIALNREYLVSWTSIMTVISSQFLY